MKVIPWWDQSRLEQDAALWLARSAQEGLRSSVMGHLQGAKVKIKRVRSNGSRMILVMFFIV